MNSSDGKKIPDNICKNNQNYDYCKEGKQKNSPFEQMKSNFI